MSKLTVAIAGAAGRGRTFIHTFAANPHTKVVALNDVNEEAVAKIASDNGIDQVYTDYEQMLEKASPDIVVIGTPMQFHASQTIMALERNIHALCEVTTAVTTDECRAIVEASKKTSVKYMMAENCCYTRTNMIVSGMVRAGLFGDIYFGEGAYIHEVKCLNAPNMWRRKWHTGINGNTYITHSLGPVYQWFGGQRITHVCCFGTGHHYSDMECKPFEQEDSVFTACRLADGGLINVRLDMLSNRPPNGSYYSLQGTNGCYEAPRGFGDKHKVYIAGRHEHETWHDLEEFADEYLPEAWHHPSSELMEAAHGGGDYLEVQEFVSAIIEDREPEVSLHKSMDLTLPGLISQQSIVQGCKWMPVPDSRDW